MQGKLFTDDMEGTMLSFMVEISELTLPCGVSTARINRASSGILSLEHGADLLLRRDMQLVKNKTNLSLFWVLGSVCVEAVYKFGPVNVGCVTGLFMRHLFYQ